MYELIKYLVMLEGISYDNWVNIRYIFDEYYCERKNKGKMFNINKEVLYDLIGTLEN